MRGYRAKGGESDEAMELARLFEAGGGGVGLGLGKEGVPSPQPSPRGAGGGGGVPVVARADRIGGLRALFKTEAGAVVDCVVLDDGFQHRKLGRDFDIVLIDATRDPFEDRLLPAGWLREPVESLARADAVVVTHAESVEREDIDRLLGRVRDVSPDTLLAVCRHEWREMVGRDDGVLPLAWLGEREAFAVCAIGNPGPFLEQVGRWCGRLAGSLVLRDHDPYGSGVVRRVIEGARAARADAIVCTEKDWSKLRHVPREDWPCEVVRPRLELGFEEGGAEVLAEALRRLGERRSD